jgi:hypothetical protein
LVEQRTENPRVGGSTPSLATIIFNNLGLPNLAAFLFTVWRIDGGDKISAWRKVAE